MRKTSRVGGNGREVDLGVSAKEGHHYKSSIARAPRRKSELMRDAHLRRNIISKK